MIKFNDRKISSMIDSISKKTSNASESMARGFVSGFIGTAAMTIAQMIEMKITKRQSSDTPVKAAESIMGFKASKSNKNNLNNLIHFSYGTGWGEIQPLISALKLPRIANIAIYFAAIWPTALIMLPALKLAPPITKWSMKDIVLDIFHHAIYVLTAGLFYHKITSSSIC